MGVTFAEKKALRYVGLHLNDTVRKMSLVLSSPKDTGKVG